MRLKRRAALWPIPLKNRIPQWRLARDSADVPRVDVAVEDGSAYLLIADNRLQVRASPQRK